MTTNIDRTKHSTTPSFNINNSEDPSSVTTAQDFISIILAMINQINAMKISCTEKDADLASSNSDNLKSAATIQQALEEAQKNKLDEEEAAQQAAEANQASQSIWGEIFGAIAIVVAVVLTGGAAGLLLGLALTTLFVLQNVKIGDDSVLNTMWGDLGIHGNWQLLATTGLCIALSMGIGGMAAMATRAANTALTTAATDGATAATTSATTSAIKSGFIAMAQLSMASGIISNSIAYGINSSNLSPETKAALIGTLNLVVMIILMIATYKVSTTTTPTSITASSNTAKFMQQIGTVLKQIIQNPKTLLAINITNGCGIFEMNTVLANYLNEQSRATTELGNLQKISTFIQYAQTRASQDLTNQQEQSKQEDKNLSQQSFTGTTISGEYLTQALLIA